MGCFPKLLPNLEMFSTLMYLPWTPWIIPFIFPPYLGILKKKEKRPKPNNPHRETPFFGCYGENMGILIMLFWLPIRQTKLFVLFLRIYALIFILMLM